MLLPEMLREEIGTIEEERQDWFLLAYAIPQQ
jgi:hypothetical protein